MKRLSFVWSDPLWPALTWRAGEVLSPLGQARLFQGRLLQKTVGLGVDLARESEGRVLVEESIKTAAIEGENLDLAAVRSSVARRMGLPTAGLTRSSRSVDGLVDVLLDATLNHQGPLTAQRLKGWQAALFPTGYSGFHRIRVGEWRGPEPMRVVSGAIGHERVHFEAPPRARLAKEMTQFLQWWNSASRGVDGLIRAGLAHFYFVTIHPFEDGNGRVARALTDMALAQDEKTGRRCYSMSAAIMANRREYYDVLERCSRGTLDVTPWLAWFLTCLTNAIKNAEVLLGAVLQKSEFWQKNAAVPLTDRQRKVLNAMLDSGPEGFAGGMTTRKYVGMTKTSRVTAFRELSDLVAKGLLQPRSTQGRSAAYDLTKPSHGWTT